MKIIKAMILCAGFGKRLRPLTLSSPKSLLKIGDKTLRAGEYSIAITPRSEGEWTVDFNSAGKYPFAYMTDGKIEMEAYILMNGYTLHMLLKNSTLEQQDL